jgi:polysaccharide biosynthesis/export protein
MKYSFAQFATVVFAASLFGAAGAAAQAPQRVQQPQGPQQHSSQPPAFSAPAATAYGGYMVGTGDLLDIRVADEDEMTGRYQVMPSGDIQLPLLKNPVHAAGLSTFDLARSIQTELQKEDLVKYPAVTVLIERGLGETITVLGQVQRPGTYPIEQTTTVIDAISMAGGLTSLAGQYATLNEHAQQSVPASNPPPAASPASASADANASLQTNTSLQQTDKVISVDLHEIMSGTRPTSNLALHAGDVLTVSDAATVYVVGAVAKPGAFTVQGEDNGITVMRAIALVEGTQPTAALGRTIIVRHSNDKDRQEIPVELDKIMKGKAPDPVLEANDILFVPQSGFKQGMHRAGDVAVLAAAEIIGYGTALRVAK